MLISQATHSSPIYDTTSATRHRPNMRHNPTITTIPATNSAVTTSFRSQLTRMLGKTMPTLFPN